MAAPDRIAVDAAERLWPWLNLVFAGLTLLAIGLVLADSDASWTRRLVGLPILAGCVASYLALVRPLAGLRYPSGWRSAIYPAMAVLGVMVLVSIHNSFWFFSLVVFFQVWMLLPLWAAAPTSAGLSLFLWVRGSIVDGEAFQPSPGSILIFAAGALISTMIGLLIWSMARQSGQRLDLIRQLEAERSARRDAEREAGALAERARLSRDLHDTLAQGFTSIVMHLEAADAVIATDSPARRPVADARQIARDSLGEVRRLVWALRPPQLRDADLAAALARMVNTWGAEHRVTAGFRVDGVGAVLSPAIEVTLLRVAQEALSNVARHAGATTVDVVLTMFDDAVHLDIRDDGCGFAPDDQPAVGGFAAGGFGLPGMRERAAGLGGSVEIESSAGAGTTIAVTLPLEPGQVARGQGVHVEGDPDLDPWTVVEMRPNVPAAGRAVGSATGATRVG